MEAGDWLVQHIVDGVENMMYILNIFVAVLLSSSTGAASPRPEMVMLSKFFHILMKVTETNSELDDTVKLVGADVEGKNPKEAAPDM